MKTIIKLNKRRTTIPKFFRDDDNRNPESLVEYFLNQYTKKGDKIFDPFAGLGTTLVVSEKMGRIPYGIEINKVRCNYIKNKIKNKENVYSDNSLKLHKHNFPKFDFVLTSPPYNPIDEKNYLSGNGGYAGFLKDIKTIFGKLKPLIKKKSYVVVEVSNLKVRGNVTTLAWDIAKEISKVLHFEGEIIADWRDKRHRKNNGDYGYGYDHSYCLIFRNI